MSNYEIECDKCGSHNVIRVLASKTQANPKPIIKMTEVAKGKIPRQNNIHNAVMTYNSYKLKCNNCGNETEPFIENQQLGTIS